MNSSQPKNVIVLAPDFSPSSRPSALRAKFLVRHLLKFGWKPIVVTVDPKHYSWPIDPDFKNENENS